MKIKYRLAIIYTDLDPLTAVDYFENLMQKEPQHIDYTAYEKALIKAANILDIQADPIKAKYYRYKIYSLNLFVKNKVVYKDSVDIKITSFIVRKRFFKYNLKPVYKIINLSTEDIKKLHADFVLKKDNKVVQTITVDCIPYKIPIYANGGESKNITADLGNNIYTKRELRRYTIDVYLYKDPKFKTLVYSHKIPQNSIYSSKTRGFPHL